MEQKNFDTTLEILRQQAVRVADKIPLPLHYIINGFVLMFWLGDLAVPDIIPFLDEIMGGVGLWYYNAYILKRTFGILNPLRIIRGESPANKRKLGLLPFEREMDQIKKRLKEMRRAARELDMPGLEPKRVDALAGEIKELEKRLRLLDRLLTRPEFQEGTVRTEIVRCEARIEMADDPGLREEYTKAIGHAREHLANIERLREERNRLVAKLERFGLQLDNSYSQLLTLSASSAAAQDTGRLFDELFTTVNAFGLSLQELEKKPAADLYSSAVKEIEEQEEKLRVRREETNRTI